LGIGLGIGLGRRNGSKAEPQHLFGDAASVMLRRIGWTHKKNDSSKTIPLKRFLYRERSESKRAEFQQQLSQIAPCDRVYLDEAGIEDILSGRYFELRLWLESQGHPLLCRALRASHQFRASHQSRFNGGALVWGRDSLSAHF